MKDIPLSEGRHRRDAKVNLILDKYHNTFKGVLRCRRRRVQAVKGLLLDNM